MRLARIENSFNQSAGAYLSIKTGKNEKQSELRCLKLIFSSIFLKFSFIQAAPSYLMTQIEQV